MTAWRVFAWASVLALAWLLVDWPWGALLFQLGALAHWTLNDPNAGSVWRDAFPELDGWRRR